MLTFVNKAGFPCLETKGVVLSGTAETFSFDPHPYVRNNFQGGMFIKVSGTPTAPSTAVPINFITTGVSDSTVAVCDSNGTALTTATWPGDGVYLAFFDRTTNILRLLTGVL